MTTGPSKRFGRSLAVVIGIDTYGEGIPVLRSAVADACAVAEALARDHSFEVWPLHERDATREHLTDLLDARLPAALGANDRLVFYFAGHGTAVDSATGPAGFLVPADAVRSDTAGFLPMHEVYNALTRLPVRHALVILDCCFAGAFRWSSLRDVVPLPTAIYRERYDRYVKSAAWQVITSASGNQLALDLLASDRGELGDTHSPFARALLAGLAGGADYTKDNLITADELAIFVREQVAPAVEAAGRSQVPQLVVLDRHDDGQFVFQVPGTTLDLGAAPPLDEDTNPYRGLRSYREQDRALFFGRDAVASRLHDVVTTAALTVVVGPSGSGKSSLVQAALMPALRAVGWDVLPPIRPTRDLPAALAAIAAHAAAPGRPWLAVVDQLEEVVTQANTADAQAAFLAGLAAVLERPGAHLVVTVRADAEPLLRESALASRWGEARFVVPGLSRDELREIIQRPASTAVLHFEPSQLVEHLIDDVTLVPAPLPLLSFALSELYRRCWIRWQRGERDRALRASDYEEMGSVAGALTQRATAVYRALVAEDAAYAQTIRNMFGRMVAFVGGERARRRVSLDELTYGDPAEDGRIATVLQRFSDARLLSLGTERVAEGGMERYAEPAHDELVRGWALVSRWIDEIDRTPGIRALLGALDAAAVAWRAGGQANALLWTDPRIELADKLTRAQPHALNAHESAFVRRSARLRRTRRWRLIGSLLAVIAVLALATGIALHQRSLAVDSAAAARRQLGLTYLEQGAQRVMADQPLHALPYLVAAREAGATGAALRSLFASATQHLWTRRIDTGEPVSIISYSPDGTMFITGGESGGAQVWDALTGAPIGPHLAHGERRVRSAEFSPDGSKVVTASEDGYALVWDARTGAKLCSPLTHGEWVTSASFSPDGERVITTSGDRTIRGGDPSARIWTWSTGAYVALPHRERVYVARFSPDGTRIVTASIDQTARVWDAVTGHPVTPWLSHDWAVTGAAFAPDGFRIATADGAGILSLWSATTGELLASTPKRGARNWGVSFDATGDLAITLDEAGALAWRLDGDSMRDGTAPLSWKHESATGVALSADASVAVTVGRDHVAKLWDVQTSQLLEPPLEHAAIVTAAALSPDTAHLITGARDGFAAIWNITREQRALRHGGRVRHAAFSSDGARAITVGTGHARILDTRTGQPLGAALVHPDVEAAEFDATGTRVLTFGSGAKLWMAGIATDLVDQYADVYAAGFDASNTQVVVIAKEPHGTSVRRWDATTHAPIGAAVMLGPISHAAVSHDGTRALSSTAERATLWDLQFGTRRELSKCQADQSVDSVAFSRDDTHAIVICEQRAEVWSTATATLEASVSDASSITAADLTPDGRRLLITSYAGTARLVGFPTGEMIAPPLEHGRPILGGAFSEDGARVVTYGEGGIVRIWDAASGQPVSRVLLHDNTVTAARFSRDGRRLITTTINDAYVRDVALDDRSLAGWQAIAETYGLREGPSIHRSPDAPPAGSDLPTQPDDDIARANSLLYAAWAALPGQIDVARRLATQANVLTRGLDYADGTAVTLQSLATIAAISGDREHMRTFVGAGATTDAEVLTQLGVRARGLRRPDIAASLLAQAAAADPASTSAALLLGLPEALLAANRLSDAVVAVDRVLARTSDVEAQLFLLAIRWSAQLMGGSDTAETARRIVAAYDSLAPVTTIKWTFSSATTTLLAHLPYAPALLARVTGVREALGRPVHPENRADLLRLLK